MAEYIKVPAGVYDMVTRCMEQEFPDHVAIRYVAEDGKTVVEKKYREYAQDIRRMIELAHAAGFAVMAHANGDRAVMAALQAGVDSIEHGAYLSESVLLRMAQQRTLWVPTLSTIGNLIGSGRYPDAVLRRLLAQQQEAVRFVAAHGGRIGLGSDAGAWHVMHGQAIPDELGYLTAALGPRTEPLLLEAEAYASVTFCRK